MTEQEKQLLLSDLCARLPYGVKVYGNYSYNDGDKIVDDKRVEVLDLSKLDWFLNGIEIKPFLRPMSSMDSEEIETYRAIIGSLLENSVTYNVPTLYNFLNSKHLDYRGLIPMGLALEAPKDMYKTHKIACDNCENKQYCSQSEYVKKNCYKL